METFGAIIDAFGGTGPFGRALGIPDSHARTMKARGSISPEYWDRLVKAAIERDIEGISFKRLTEIRSASRRKSASSQAEASAA
jgi:hypothetical protein